MASSAVSLTPTKRGIVVDQPLNYQQVDMISSVMTHQNGTRSFFVHWKPCWVAEQDLPLHAVEARDHCLKYTCRNSVMINAFQASPPKDNKQLDKNVQFNSTLGMSSLGVKHAADDTATSSSDCKRFKSADNQARLFLKMAMMTEQEDEEESCDDN